MKKVLAVILLIILALAVGYNLGRYNTIRSAELVGVTGTTYRIGFGNEVHTYTFEEVR